MTSPLPRAARLLTIVGGVRERSAVTRRRRGKTVCARGAYGTLLGGPSTSPLGIMQLRAPQGSSDGAWLALRSALWSDVSEAEQLSGMADALARGHYVRLAVTDGGSVGLVVASKRVDYVNGTSSSPVAFLEGLYVVPTSRRQGVARALVESVVQWALAEGCSELASDSLLENSVAHAAHRALGFEETERVVYFRRGLHDA